MTTIDWIAFIKIIISKQLSEELEISTPSAILRLIGIKLNALGLSLNSVVGICETRPDSVTHGVEEEIALAASLLVLHESLLVRTIKVKLSPQIGEYDRFNKDITDVEISLPYLNSSAVFAILGQQVNAFFKNNTR